MSLAADEQTDGSMEEASHEHEQKEPETNGSDQKHQKHEDVTPKDHLQVNPRQRRTIGPLTLFKEDLNHFKEDFLNVFKEKDSKATQDENKASVSTLSLLKDDFSLFKEGVTSVFNKDKDTKSTDPKTSQLINPLTLLKEDFSQLKEDISSVFRISLLKERDNKSITPKVDDSSNSSNTSHTSNSSNISNSSKTSNTSNSSHTSNSSKTSNSSHSSNSSHTSNTVRIKDSKSERNERSDEPFKKLFRKDQSKVFYSFRRAENVPEDKKTVSEKSEEQIVDGFRGNLSETVKAGWSQLEERQLDVKVSEDKTETKKSEDVSKAEQRCGTEERSDDSEEDEKEEDKSFLSSGIRLFSLRDANKDDKSEQPGGDVWQLKNSACYLTFDPNTANSELRLTDRNRKATRVWSDHRASDHPDRFERCPQLLCREGLLDTAYWEVLWSGGADIGVTYNSICRDGDASSCLLGFNERSWSLECSEGSYTPSHNSKRLRSCSPQPFTRRVGVYLDWFAGSLSFYCVSQDAMVHLHTFTSTFTEPLYPGFWVWAYDGSVALRQVELDWERLLQ